MNKMNEMNFFHRVFLGWLGSQIMTGRVPASRAIEDMAPIDLRQNGDLFEQFLNEEDEKDHWQKLEREHGPIEVLTYFRG